MHNDFHSTHGIFDVLKGLEVKNMDDPSAPIKPYTNGYHQANGTAELHDAYKVDEKAAQSEVLN